MTALYNRRFEILIDGEQFIPETEGRQFKFTFTILHDFGGAVSYCDFRVFNLTKSSSNDAFRKGRKVTIRAGYVNNIDVIFQGVINNAVRPAGGVNSITRVFARGGNILENRTIVNQAIGAPAKVTDIVTACATALGLDTVMNVGALANEPDYPRGYTLAGDPRAYLDRLASAHNFMYTIENDKLVIVENGTSITARNFLVSQFTGMEGAPEITEIGADVTLRLWPQMRIGGKITIESQFADFNFSNLYFQDIPESAGVGEYNIIRIEHSGDSVGDTWSTRVTGVR